jgi:hypothetical protein
MNHTYTFLILCTFLTLRAAAADPWGPAYTIKFPGDVMIDECGDLIPGDIELQNAGCGVLAVSRDTVRFDTPAGICSKYQITYKVINWCEYDGGPVLEPTVIPRDLDADDDLGECTWIKATHDPWFVREHLYNHQTGEDHTLDGNGWKTGANYGIVKVFSADASGQQKELPDKVMVRYTCTKSYGYHSGDHVGYLIYRLNKSVAGKDGRPKYELYCFEWAEELCDNIYAAPCWSPGYYSYTRMVKVKNAGAPQIVVETTDLDFCAYGNGQASCDGLVSVTFAVSGSVCVQESSLKAVRLQLGRAGAAVDGTGNLYQVKYLGDHRWRVWGRLPEGEHRFTLQVRDDCGNITGGAIDFSVADCQAPAPVCIYRLRIPLMPVDSDHDGRIDGGANALPATSFIASQIDDCNRSAPAPYNVLYFAVKENELEGGPETITTDHLTEARQTARFTCEDPENLTVYIVALDGAGNFSYCPVSVNLRGGRRPGPCERQGIAAAGEEGWTTLPEDAPAVSTYAGAVHPSAAVGEAPAAGFALEQNVPNPFRGETTLAFSLPQAGEATLSVFDLNGRAVKVVRGHYDAGYHQIRLTHQELPATGVWYYQLRAGEFSATRRMVVVGW